jgi:hypothetical protein
LVTDFAEQVRGEGLGGAAQLRPRHRDRPGRGLDRRLAVAVATARPGVRAVCCSLVAGPAQEQVDLGLHRGLDDQPGAQPGNVLDDLRQVTRPVEQGVDLATDAIGG